MAKVQTGNRIVDDAGYVLVTRAVHCDIRTRKIPASAFSSPFPKPRSRKRSVLFIRNTIATGGGEKVYIAGDRAEVGTGFPLAVGETLRLPVSASVIVRATAAFTASDASTLDIG